MRSGRAWPFLLVGLLLFGVGVNVGLLLVARADPSFAVENDYYEKALAWDATARQTERDRELGWSVGLDAAASPRGPGWYDLALTVRDAAGAPVRGASVGIETFHHARAADVLRVGLEEREGRYVATLPLRRRGLWELRVRVERGETVFTATLQEELGGLR